MFTSHFFQLIIDCLLLEINTVCCEIEDRHEILRFLCPMEKGQSWWHQKCGSQSLPTCMLVIWSTSKLDIRLGEIGAYLRSHSLNLQSSLCFGLFPHNVIWTLKVQYISWGLCTCSACKWSGVLTALQCCFFGVKWLYSLEVSSENWIS